MRFKKPKPKPKEIDVSESTAFKKLKIIKDGPYKGQYEGNAGVIYNEEIARRKFPDEFKPNDKNIKRNN